GPEATRDTLRTEEARQAPTTQPGFEGANGVPSGPLQRAVLSASHSVRSDRSRGWNADRDPAAERRRVTAAVLFERRGEGADRRGHRRVRKCIDDEPTLDARTAVAVPAHLEPRFRVVGAQRARSDRAFVRAWLQAMPVSRVQVDRPQQHAALANREMHRLTGR